jgi:hypothetical protein
VLTDGRLNVDRAVDLILTTQGAVPVATFTVGQSLNFLGATPASPSRK